MKSILQQIISKNKEDERVYASSIEAEINNPETSTNRRNCFRRIDEFVY
jgi:ribosomal protein L18